MIDKNVRNRAIKTTYLEYQGDLSFIKDILLASDCMRAIKYHPK